jgi:hypothetical protein
LKRVGAGDTRAGDNDITLLGGLCILARLELNLGLTEIFRRFGLGDAFVIAGRGGLRESGRRERHRQSKSGSADCAAASRPNFLIPKSLFAEPLSCGFAYAPIDSARWIKCRGRLVKRMFTRCNRSATPLVR